MIRDLVVERSGGMCEAMVCLPTGVWTRCGVHPIEDHHMLTRARGGDVLDELGEIYHHMALCMRHHKHAHEMSEDTGMIMEGSVYRDGGAIVYVGPDQYLSRKYGKAP